MRGDWGQVMARVTKEQIKQMADRTEARAHGIADDDDAEWERGFDETCEKVRREHSREIIEAEIERLALLTPIEYEIERPAVAQCLSMRASVLDSLVRAKRPNGHDDGQGRAVQIADLKPWHDPIDGGTLAAALVSAIKKYVVLRDDQADTIAFWILHTWLVNEFHISPRLAITSPTKGCGKTTVLRLLNIITRRPKRTGSISPPALFRAVEIFQPTMLLDETEKYVEHGSDLHALLNEGHCKGASVMRVLGDKLELREFAIYGAAAFARNGPMPDDLDQRSIVIELQRRKADEPLEELREEPCEPLIQLARMCARWAGDNADAIRGCDPEMGHLINRGGDNWRPIIAIANVVGGEWPSRLVTAAGKLAPREPGSVGVILLGDIKAMAADEKADRLTSTELAETLHGLEGRPWAEWGRNGKPISPNQVARLLKEFKVYPETIRIGADRTARGYYLNKFAEAFERYLGPQGGNEPAHRHNVESTGTSEPFQTETEKNVFRSESAKKPASNGHCVVVSVQKGGGALFNDIPGADVPVCAHCGAPATADHPVQLVAVEGEEFLLHRDCRADWINETSPDLSIPPFLQREPNNG
jgi:putative DNA primase/helicase